MKRKNLYIIGIFVLVALCTVLYLVVTPRKTCTYNSHPGQYLHDPHDCIYQEAYIPIHNATTTSESLTSVIDSSFKCPEDYNIEEERTQALADSFGAYLKQYPDSTLQQKMIYRNKFLVSHSCDQTLKNLLQDVDPVYSPTIHFVGKDFVTSTVQFDQDTKVWTAYYPLSGQNPEDPDEELIFNFYVKNIYASKNFSAKDVADAYVKNSNTEIIYSFSAPDPITKEMAYFIYSDVIYSQPDYAYVYITKYSSINDSVFAVTYSKKIIDSGANLEEDVNTWLLNDTNDKKAGIAIEIGDIGVDSSWIDYLTAKDQK
jgi:hypothetical protein